MGIVTGLFCIFKKSASRAMIHVRVVRRRSVDFNDGLVILVIINIVYLRGVYLLITVIQ